MSGSGVYCCLIAREWGTCVRALWLCWISCGGGGGGGSGDCGGGVLPFNDYDCGSSIEYGLCLWWGYVDNLVYHLVIGTANGP